MALVPTQTSWEARVFEVRTLERLPRARSPLRCIPSLARTVCAEIVSVTQDVIEASVARPPETREHSLRLARQQFSYCTDIVTQGTETIANLAAGLINADAWFFWWD